MANRSLMCTRRGLLGAAGAGVVTALASSRLLAQAAASARDADAVVLNAKVHTVDPRLPQAEAFAIRSGRFIAVGSNEDIRALIGNGTETFDAARASVVPGFIDAHNHAVGYDLLYEVSVGNPFEVEFVTIASIVDKLAARARETQPGYWVEGFFYDDTKVKDQRAINVHDLDKVSREHPVAVHHRGGHTSYYNSKAFELAHITRDTPNPPGGTIDRGEHGDPNGRVTDRALALLENVGRRPTFTAAQAAERAKAAQAHISRQFVRYGLTSVHHEQTESTALAALESVREEGALLHRVYFAVSGPLLESMIANGIRTGFGDEWLRFGTTFEHLVDGSFSERTMALSIPYPGSKSGYRGNLTESQDELNAWIERVHRAGIQVNCHANGDVAIAQVLTALEQAQHRYPLTDSRPKITHCTLINDDLLRRIKAVGAVPAPFSSYAYYNSDKFHFYGEELMRRCMAYRSFIDGGIRAAAGSDFPPGPFAPLMGIQGMVTRTGWNGETWGAEQRITPAEALQIYTLNGAYASHEERIKGSITPGKLADYVVLSDDPHAVVPDRIKDIRVVRTVTGGRTVYQA